MSTMQNLFVKCTFDTLTVLYNISFYTLYTKFFGYNHTVPSYVVDVSEFDISYKISQYGLNISLL
jgi:hypothetical protein